MDSKKSIVITGASSGIGAALTRALANDGHDLYVCARRVDWLAKVVDGHPSAFYSGCDVGQEAQVKKFFQQIQQRSNSVDALIHCAGILGPVGLFSEVNGEEWLATVRTNLFGAFLVAREVVPLMHSECRPRIILLSGGGAFTPMARVSAYGLSKAAIVRLVETLALELAPRNIAVNAVAPGFVATDIHAGTLAAGRERAGEYYEHTLRRLAEGDEGMELPIDCIRYMISEASARLTGKTISARYDPWGEPDFDRRIDEIVSSPLYTSHRVIPSDIKDATLAKVLQRAAENARKRRQRQTVAQDDQGRRSIDSRIR
jgi:NAD(P)-dependent dehydrogenase (short-subunit alcohol dehydrogenase family)